MCSNLNKKQSICECNIDPTQYLKAENTKPLHMCIAGLHMMSNIFQATILLFIHHYHENNHNLLFDHPTIISATNNKLRGLNHGTFYGTLAKYILDTGIYIIV